MPESGELIKNVNADTTLRPLHKSHIEFTRVKENFEETMSNRKYQIIDIKK